ncbi:Trk system potassium uptake protein TrkG [Anaerohalosphaera lusitana]|uniref:Trk system potassium uptake protein TrkG n=1 Tax=Anaerohalosphaera lusitana TaxID=1936003 RepID=A0A1U9NGL4_9BACT|nr:TrkH family potassium uptake protein [Anaerohalosphaera lusitana]AQT66945.1 Trk system potassium uptake protein TrkG [Anaerohalosphaera lusitana]
MNYKVVFKQLGVLVFLVGACMSTSLIWAFLDRKEEDFGQIASAFLLSIFICIGIGLILNFRRTQTKKMYRKEAIAVVSIGWFLCGILGALPYIFSGVLAPLYDGWFSICSAAVFESISGFTTTGASIFPEPESLPRAILFWRSLTHWLGGMGIIVLFVAILGEAGSGAKHMVISEVPGLPDEAPRPRIRSAAMLLWNIYVAISVAEVIALNLQGMSIFESLCHTFGTMATGGFSTLNGSIGQYNNLGYEITIIVFMLLAGTSFNLYAILLGGGWRRVLSNREFQIYLLIVLCAVILLTTDIILDGPEEYTAGKALQDSSFQAVSIMTTTGYGTADFDRWPDFSRWLLVLLMFVGGCAGSTGGGLKVIRVVLFFKILSLEIASVFRPRAVKTLKIGDRPVDKSVRQNVTAYLGLVLVIFFLSTLILFILHNDYCMQKEDRINIETAFSSVAATLNNIGPGLAMVGPTENYAFFSAPAKLFFSLLMILGRLEVMVILCMFMPSFWKKE